MVYSRILSLQFAIKNKHRGCSFKNSVDRHFEALLKGLLALAHPALQLAIAAVTIFQAIASWSRHMNRDQELDFEDPVLILQLKMMASTLLSRVDALEIVI